MFNMSLLNSLLVFNVVKYLIVMNDLPHFRKNKALYINE